MSRKSGAIQVLILTILCSVNSLAKDWNFNTEKDPMTDDIVYRAKISHINEGVKANITLNCTTTNDSKNIYWIYVIHQFLILKITYLSQ